MLFSKQIQARPRICEWDMLSIQLRCCLSVVALVSKEKCVLRESTGVKLIKMNEITVTVITKMLMRKAEKSAGLM